MLPVEGHGSARRTFGSPLLLRRRHRSLASLWRAGINQWVKCAPELHQDLNPALGTEVFVSDQRPIVVRFDLEGAI